MSYQVLLDGQIIHDPTMEDAAYILADPVVTQEANLVPAFAFTMYPGHAKYNAPNLITSIVEVLDDGESIFRGRILDTGRNWDNAKEMICEGELAYFNDTVVRPYAYSGGVTDYLAMLVTQHNAQVPTHKRITLRSVTVTDPNDYIVRGNTNYPSTWQEITDKCIELLGGYLILERIGGVNYLDWLVDSPYATLQSIDFGVNLLDFSENVKGSEIITALIPLGARPDNTPDDDDDRLTIASVNGGVDYIFDAAAVAKYGLIFATQIWDDVTTPVALLAKGRVALNDRINMQSSIELTAVDLANLDSSIDSFRFLEYVRVVSAPHGVDSRMLIRKLVTDLAAPENSQLTIGEERKGASWYASDAQKKTELIIKDYVVNDQLHAVADDVLSLFSLIEQTAEQIRLEVGSTYVTQTDYNERILELSSEIVQTASQLTIAFNNSITVVRDDLSATQQQITTYFDFGADGLILGLSNSDYKVRIDNSSVTILYKDMETTTITADQSYMPSLRTDLLEQGNFQWRPTQDGGYGLYRM